MEVASATQDSEESVHLNVKNNEIFFQCSICCQMFRSKSGLHGHFERKHTSYTSPHQCFHCLKRFSHKGDLNRHQLIHQGVKPFCCHLCPKRFRQKFDLTIHLRRHSGDMPFQCRICSRRFVCKKFLRRHLTRIHPARHDSSNSGQATLSTTERHPCFVPGSNLGEEELVRRSDYSLVQSWRGIQMKECEVRLTRYKCFQCQDCHLAFSQEQTLGMHKRLHS